VERPSQDEVDKNVGRVREDPPIRYGLGKARRNDDRPRYIFPQDTSNAYALVSGGLYEGVRYMRVYECDGVVVDDVVRMS